MRALRPHERNQISIALIVYGLTLLVAYFVVTINTLTSYGIYYIFSYGYYYVVIRNAYASVLILYLIYLITYSVLRGRFNLVNYLLIIASTSLLILNYIFIVSHVMINNLTLIPLPLSMMISSRGTSVISIDWGQISLLTLILIYYTSRGKTQATMSSSLT